MSPAVGPYSPVRRAGDWVDHARASSAWPPTATARPGAGRGRHRPELRQALANVAEVLAVEGATLADVVKTTVFLIDMADFAAVNEV